LLDRLFSFVVVIIIVVLIFLASLAGGFIVVIIVNVIIIIVLAWTVMELVGVSSFNDGVFLLLKLARILVFILTRLP
jgi:hypothetical protein